MTAALEGGEWSTARPGRTLPPGKTRYPFHRRLGGPQSRSGRAENLIPTGIRSRTVQPVVSRYTGWATRATYVIYMCLKSYAGASYNGTNWTPGDPMKAPGCTLCQLRSDTLRTPVGTVPYTLQPALPFSCNTNSLTYPTSMPTLAASSIRGCLEALTLLHYRSVETAPELHRILCTWPSTVSRKS